MLTIEPYEIESVVTGHLRLDGGAMFGVVPKVLWKSRVDVDEDNRILLATRTLLAVHRTERRVVVVETGCGSKWSAEQRERYAVAHDANALDRALSARGLSRADVTDVVITHLHFDHNGGLTEWADEPGGATKLAFERATHWVHARQWAQALSPGPRDRASYRREDFAPLIDHPRLALVEGDEPACPIPGMTWLVSQGHTPYQLQPVFGDGPRKLVFVGDMVPTVNHLPVAWGMAYDLEPVATVAEKQRLYERCQAEELVLAFPHDPEHAAVLLDTRTGKPIVTESVAL